MLPVVDPTGEHTARQILFYSLALIPISVIPRYLGMSGNIYLAGALMLGMVYFYSGVLVARHKTRADARRVLLASIVYLPVLYMLMMADRTSL
jgi:heme o synthase